MKLRKMLCANVCGGGLSSIYIRTEVQVSDILCVLYCTVQYVHCAHRMSKS